MNDSNVFSSARLLELELVVRCNYFPTIFESVRKVQIRMKNEYTQHRSVKQSKTRISLLSLAKPRMCISTAFTALENITTNALQQLRSGLISHNLKLITFFYLISAMFVIKNVVLLQLKLITNSFWFSMDILNIFRPT